MNSSGKYYTNGSMWKMNTWSIKASMPRGKTHMSRYVPFVDFIKHTLSCDVFSSLPHVQRLGYGIVIPPTSIIHLTWLKDQLGWIIVFLVEHSNIFLSDLLRRILLGSGGFNLNFYKNYWELLTDGDCTPIRTWNWDQTRVSNVAKHLWALCPVGGA